MDWKSIAAAVGKAAPLLGTLIGGPLGGIAGGLVATALGTSNDAESISAALAADPDAMVKLRELEMNNQVQLKQLAVSAELNRMNAENAQYAAEASDRDSARKLAATQPNDKVRPALTFMLLGGTLALVAGMVFAPGFKELLKDATAAVTVGTVIGYLFGEVKTTMGFWFGMTKDSSNQSNAIAKFAMSPGSVTTDHK